MSRISYVNGRYLPYAKAMVHIEDRGYQFADGVYEVVGIYEGHFLDEKGHLDRLERSLRELRISLPVSIKVLRFILREIQRRNFLRSGLVYIQISRGVAPRYHPFPDPPVKPSLIVIAKNIKVPSKETVEKGVGVITLPETRWARCDIKSIALLPNILAKQEAIENTAYESWFVDQEGLITEGTASNAWIITKNNVLKTRQTDVGILSGITRKTIIEIASKMNLSIEEKAFTVEEAENAQEAFISSATNYVMPVTSINKKLISAGKAGPIALKLREKYLKEVISQAQKNIL